MQYYTYKITFKDLPGYFYYGKRKDNGKPYFGSPKTWKHLWQQFEPEVQILQWYETAKEVEEAEVTILKATWKDKYSLNENVRGVFSEEAASRGGKKTGRVNGPANLAKIPREKKVAGGKVAGKINVSKMPREAKVTGAANQPLEVRVANGKASVAKISKDTLVANGKANIARMSRESMVAGGRANGKATCSQKWRCLVTGHVSNPGGLTSWQKARGIETSLRVRVGEEGAVL